MIRPQIVIFTGSKKTGRMKIEKNTMVSLIYELRESGKEGRIIEALEENRPLQFIYGSGRLLPSFESNISGLSQGESFSFILSAEDAYGEKEESMIIDVPVSVFTKDGKVDETICQVGNEVPMMDSQGNPLTGVINEITDTHVKMDFNHPMAGVDLCFSGRITEVREASLEELDALKHNHSCSSCGSHSSNGCQGSCSGDDENL